jgi:putative membrane protein
MNATKALLIVLGVLAAIALLSATAVGGMMGGMMSPGMMGPGMMYGYGSQAVVPATNGWTWAAGMGLGWVAMLAFWGALIVGVVLLIRYLAGQSASSITSADAQELLRRRYAAGEIDEVTYERMRQKLAA